MWRFVTCVALVVRGPALIILWGVSHVIYPLSGWHGRECSSRYSSDVAQRAAWTCALLRNGVCWLQMGQVDFVPREGEG